MNKLFSIGAVCLLFGLAAVGCSNTEEGAAKDANAVGQKVAAGTEQAGQAVKNAGENAADAAKNAADATKNAAANAADATKNAAVNAGHAVKEVGKDTAENTSVRPKVKLAITADKELNNTANEIHVEPKDGVVHLRGHVISDAMKSKAESVTTNALKDMKSTDTVQNELTVSGK